MAYDIGAKIGIDGEKEFRDAIKNINTNMRTLGTEMLAVSSQFDKNEKSAESLTARNNVLNKQIDEQKNKLSELAKGLDASSDKYGKNDKVTQSWQQAVNKATADLNNMERELKQNNAAIEGYGKEIKNADKGTNDFEKSLGKLKGELKDVTSNLGKAALNGFKTIGAAATGAIAGIIALNESTKEYNTDLSILEQNAKASGNSFDLLKNHLSDITSVTGEADSSVEALSNLMATGFDDNEMTQAVDALSGAIIKFPDTLKIEGLADGLQETLATGAAAGSFAELIERMGGDLESFNLQLEGTTTEAERQQVALDWLANSGLAQLNSQYRETNKEALAAAESQFKFTDTMAELGKAVGPIVTQLMTEVSEVATAMTTYVQNNMPMIQEVISNVFDKIETGLGWLLDNKETLIATVAGIGTGLLTWNVISIISGVVQAIKAFQIANEGATLAQAALNIALNANPVGIVITAVAALTAGIITLWNTNEDFRNAVTTAWNNMKAVAESVFTWIRDFLNVDLPAAFNNVKTMVINVFNYIRNVNWKDLGINIIAGIAGGVKNAASKLVNSVVAAANNALHAVQSFLGIQSPSTVMRDRVGKMIGYGIAEGIEESEKKILDTVEEVGEALIDEELRIQKELEKLELKAIEDREAESEKKYKAAIAKKYDALATAEGEGKQKLLNEIAKMQADREAELARQSEKTLQNSLNNQLKTVQNFRKEYEKTTEEIARKQDEFADKLMGYGELFIKTQDLFGNENMRLTNLQDQINEITEYGYALEYLKSKNIPGSLLEQVKEMSIEDAIDFSYEVLEMTNEEYTKYISLWEEKQKKAKEVAIIFYKDEMSGLKTEFVDQIPVQLSGIKDQMNNLGVNAGSSLAQGLISQSKLIMDTFRGVIADAIDAAKDELDINSPSRVMRDDVGKMIGLGLAEGISDSTRSVNAAMHDLTDVNLDFDIGLGSNRRLAGATNNNSNIVINMHNTVRSDDDIRKINRGLRKELNNYSRAIGVTG